MKRRVAVSSVVGLVAMPFVAQAQTGRPLRKIAYLHPRTIAPDHSTVMILRAAWLRLGYIEGETVLLRSADNDIGRVPALVAELAGLGVAALIVVGAAAVAAASRATKSLPLVAIDLETDPVGAGLAASFSRPGGNVTGLFLDQPSMAGKWIDLLRDAALGIGRLALLCDRSTGSGQLDIARRVAGARGFEVAVLELGSIADFDDALRRIAGQPRAGIVQLGSAGFAVVAGRFAAAAQKHRLPSISILSTYVRSGVLMSYGPIQEVYFPRAVVFADKIGRGAAPGELPIEGPNRFELVINRKTAKAIGIALPQTLLLRADEVIE